jgi:sugar phosphate isomerase/epimerase
LDPCNADRREGYAATQGTLTRRAFIGAAAGAALAGRSFADPLSPAATRPESRIAGVQIGVITYSFRSMADQSAEALLQDVLQSGISGVELMGDPAERYAGIPTGANATRAAIAAWRAGAPMHRFEQLGKMYRDAGVTIYAFKPGTFGADSTDAEMDYGMRAAKLLGASHVTAELPTDAGLAQRLGNMAGQHGIRIGYHQHLQATPTLWDAALAASPANGINLDLGHFIAAGDYDGLEFLRQHHARITSMHLKDRKSKAHGQENLPWGQGDTPIGAALRLMRDQQYAFPASIELEYDIPTGSDAVREVRRCLDYCREALRT